MSKFEAARVGKYIVVGRGDEWWCFYISQIDRKNLGLDCWRQYPPTDEGEPDPEAIQFAHDYLKSLPEQEVDHAMSELTLDWKNRMERAGDQQL